MGSASSGVNSISTGKRLENEQLNSAAFGTAAYLQQLTRLYIYLSRRDVLLVRYSIYSPSHG